MSLWPVKIKYKELVECEKWVTIDYAEFAEWSGVDINDATDEQIIEFLEAGAELGYGAYDPEVVSRRLSDS